MKNIPLFLYSLLLIICLPLLALKCENVDPASKEELLSKEWKVSQVLITNIPDQSMDYSGYRRRFDAGGNYTFTNVPGTILTGTWEFDSNKQNLILDKNTSKPQTVRVVVLDANNLELEFIVVNYKMDQHLVVYKMVL
ncbi:hypothetical protein GXP67_17725 [Rhodocytophaga rosea]|uniref:Lipocalin-like domain-containing protein n=1 Tax=Rhodocytophaga rosea TaxID=2704465 RepID=A0A6C0GK61_9BACT|nr:hypothetical protein [Rhodocytophaga rosea]QHT68349.1 hypothetical protein GXP67_17725 [Rhodocytophaga rosea]